MNIRSVSAGALLALGAALGSIASAGATYTVPGTSNPFLAGMPTGSSCCSGGDQGPDVAPAESPTFAGDARGGEVFTFTNVKGSVCLNPTCPPLGPDGGGPVSTPENERGLKTINNIAGFYNAPAEALIGVFLGPGLPTGVPAPGLLNFGSSGSGTIVGTTFTTLSPDLQQIFFIGDGLTGRGTGSIQTFTAPVGATRLFLGTVDGYGWSNNGGKFSVTVNGSVPEPSTWAMMLLGFAGLGYAGFRRSAKVAALQTKVPIRTSRAAWRPDRASVVQGRSTGNGPIELARSRPWPSLGMQRPVTPTLLVRQTQVRAPINDQLHEVGYEIEICRFSRSSWPDDRSKRKRIRSDDCGELKRRYLCRRREFVGGGGRWNRPDRYRREWRFNADLWRYRQDRAGPRPPFQRRRRCRCRNKFIPQHRRWVDFGQQCAKRRLSRRRVRPDRRTHRPCAPLA